MRKALVVGINDYPNSPFDGCVNDANAMATTLEYNGGGSRNFAVEALLSPGNEVTRVVLRGAIEKLFSGSPDMALLYFSGHGFIKSDGGYLVTTDAQQYSEGLSMNDVLQIANASSARNKVIILDCCHAGALAKPNLAGLSMTTLSEGLTILTASADDESALEIDGAGVFTSLLVDALQGGAADIRGYITPGSLYAYVDEALGAWDQRPIFKTNVSSFAVLRTISPKVPLDTLRKLTEYFETPDAHHNLDPSYEFTEPSASPDNVDILKNMQKFMAVGLVLPVDTEHLYFAAMESKACRLTALGYQYWRLVAEKHL